jgi:hypothetical protein
MNFIIWRDMCFDRLVFEHDSTNYLIRRKSRLVLYEHNLYVERYTVVY